LDPGLINNNDTENTSGIAVNSNISFLNTTNVRNLIEWYSIYPLSNGDPQNLVYGGISISSYNTSVDTDLFGIDFLTRNTTTYATRMRIKPDGTVECVSVTQTSDDRIKKDEQYISNAIETITKLRPQTYNKYETLDCSGYYKFESGLIAQEIYYDVPELRHLVDIDISGHVDTSEDPSIDPDYSNWGSNIASVNYIGLIPYCIQAIKEQQIMINENNNRIETEQLRYNDLLSRIQALEN